MPKSEVIYRSPHAALTAMLATATTGAREDEHMHSATFGRFSDSVHGCESYYWEVIFVRHIGNTKSGGSFMDTAEHRVQRCLEAYAAWEERQRAKDDAAE
jgi:hypothetical protein